MIRIKREPLHPEIKIALKETVVVDADPQGENKQMPIHNGTSIDELLNFLSSLHPQPAPVLSMAQLAHFKDQYSAFCGVAQSELEGEDSPNLDEPCTKHDWEFSISMKCNVCLKCGEMDESEHDPW